MSVYDMSDMVDNEEHEMFRRWFQRLLHQQKTCFERDVLRSNMNNLKASWMKWAKKYDIVQSGMK